MCVNNLSKVALDSAAAGIEPATSSCKSNAVTTAPQSHRTEPPGKPAHARWAGCSAGQVGRHINFEGGSGTEEEPQWPLAGEGGLSSYKLFEVFEFLVTLLLMGPVCLLSQGRFEVPVRIPDLPGSANAD